MRAVIKLSVFFLVTAIGLYFVILGFSKGWEDSGDQGVVATVNKVNEMYTASGSYPGEMEVASTEVWGVFSGPKIVYSNRAEGCLVYYYQWPLGPHKGMDCASREWFFDE